MNEKGKNNRSAGAQRLIAGFKKRLPNGLQVLPMGGTPLTVDGATAKLQQLVDLREAVTAAQATAAARVGAEDAAMPPLSALIKALIACIRVMFGDDVTALADFGVAPHKAPTPLTAAAKAVAAAKREATRKARGTRSAKQKKAIKGNVTAAVVVTPAAPAPAPAPVRAVDAPAK